MSVRSFAFSLLVLCSSLFIFAGCSSSGDSTKEPEPPVEHHQPFRNKGKDGKEKKIEAMLPDSRAEEELLEKATEAYDQEMYSVAKTTFTELRDKYPGSYYSQLAELKIADCDYILEEMPTALTAYEEFLRLHPQHEAAAYAKYQIANCYRGQYRGIKHDQGPLNSAVKAYQRVINEHPDSRYTPLAKTYLSGCRERLAEHEAYVAEFYLKQGKTEASAKRYKELTGNFKGSQAAAEAKEKLADVDELQAYQTQNKLLKKNPTAGSAVGEEE